MLNINAIDNNDDNKNNDRNMQSGNRFDYWKTI